MKYTTFPSLLGSRKVSGCAPSEHLSPHIHLRRRPVADDKRHEDRQRLTWCWVCAVT